MQTAPVLEQSKPCLPACLPVRLSPTGSEHLSLINRAPQTATAGPRDELSLPAFMRSTDNKTDDDADCMLLLQGDLKQGRTGSQLLTVKHQLMSR